MRWVTLELGYMIHHIGFTKNMSNLSYVRLLISLRFDHVNLGLENPRFTILQVSRQSLKIRDLFISTLFPPNLSSSASTSLKSPVVIQSLLWRLATCKRLFHSTHLSLNLGLAYTAERNHLESKVLTLTVT